MSSKTLNCPNLFLIGAPKAGTTALAQSLSLHPDIFCKTKEPRFFDAQVFYDDPTLYPIKNIEDYLENYACEEAMRSRYCLDASVFIMYSADAISEILKLRPDSKFLLVLRDPISATKSMFIQRLKYVEQEMREVSDDFGECLALLDSRAHGDGLPKGCKTSFVFRYDALYHYERYLDQIIDLVGAENVLVLRYEDYKENPSEFFLSILEWLDLDSVTGIDSSVEVNSGSALSFNYWNRIMIWLAKFSFPIRKVLGLTGDRVGRVKDLLNSSFKEQKVVVGKENDERLRMEFDATYKFLGAGEAKGTIRRIRT